jgi:hypothetical protein
MIRGDEVRDRGSCKSKRHLGVDFVIWTLENAWFWLVLRPHGTGGMIGATTNEARAMREVCLSVEGYFRSRERDPRKKWALRWKQPSFGSGVEIIAGVASLIRSMRPEPNDGTGFALVFFSFLVVGATAIASLLLARPIR